MERRDLTHLIDRIEAPLFLACGATGAGLQARVWWGFAVGVVALAAVLLLVRSDRRALERGAEPSMGLDAYHRLVRLLWWAAGMVLAGSSVTVIVNALVSAVRGGWANDGGGGRVYRGGARERAGDAGHAGRGRFSRRASAALCGPTTPRHAGGARRTGAGSKVCFAQGKTPPRPPFGRPDRI